LWDRQILESATSKEGLHVSDSPLPAQTRDTLLALNRSATTARLMSGVVHEVNNALQVISGTVELLETRPDLPPALAPSLERVRKQSGRAAQVLTDVLMFTRASVKEAGRINMREIAEHSLSLRAFAVRRAGLTTKLDAPESAQFRVAGNRAQLQQALLNLINNAEQALAGSPGEIVVELDATDTDVIIRVVDPGPGIPLQPPEQAFELFRTTKDPWDGAGLGLWAARAIAAEHGGSLTIEDRPQGTAIVMRLPKAID